MPVIKSAKKKLRQDKKRTVRNQKMKDLLKRLIKKARKNPSEKTIKEATKITDKAAKQNIIHKNKAAHMKSALSKLLKKKASPVIVTKVVKNKQKAPKKTASGL